MQKNAKVVTIDAYEDVPRQNEAALQKAVANQVVSVAIEGSSRDFQHYDSVSSSLTFACNSSILQIKDFTLHFCACFNAS